MPEGSLQQEGWHQPCWACGTLVFVPVFGGEPVPLFKCGWCGAHNSFTPSLASHTPASPTLSGCYDAAHHDTLDAQQKQQVPPRAPPRLQLSAPQAPCPTLPSRVAGAFMAALVLGLVTVVVVASTAVLLPGAFGPWSLVLLHLPLAAVMTVNVLLNYTACLLSHPGPVKAVVEEVVGPDSLVPRGAFEHYQHCERCAYYKPPTAHHCRKCGTCIHRLDHHCWYLGSKCVGAANMRPFIRFLAWLVLGVGYALLAAGIMGWRERRLLTWHTYHVWQASARFSLGWRLLSYSLRWVLSAPLWVALWGFTTALCTATLLLVGLLLYRQLLLLSRGQSYLDVLKQQQRQQQGGQQADAYHHPQQQGRPGSAPPVVEGPGRTATASADATLQGMPATSTLPWQSPAAGPGSRAVGRAVPAAKPPLGVSAGWWESLQGRAMRAVFGSGHPLLWLFPLVRPGDFHLSRKLS